MSYVFLFVFFLLVRQTTIGCGNVGISRAVRDFQGAVETVLWFPSRRHFHSRVFVGAVITGDRVGRDRVGCPRSDDRILGRDRATPEKRAITAGRPIIAGPPRTDEA